MNSGTEAPPRGRWSTLRVVGAVLAELGFIGAFGGFAPVIRYSGMVVFVVGLVLSVLKGGWRNFEPAAPSVETGSPPDRLLALGVGLALIGPLGAWLAWMARPDGRIPTWTWIGAGAALLGLVLAIVRGLGLPWPAIREQAAADQTGLEAWEKRNPSVPYAILAAGCVAGLVYLAVRRTHPPFVPDPWTDRQIPAVDPGVVAGLLWTLLGFIAALGTAAGALRVGWASTVTAAILVGSAALALSLGAAAAYVLLLRIPLPAVLRAQEVGWLKCGLGFAVLALAVALEIARQTRLAIAARTGVAPSAPTPAGSRGPTP
jgi:hypothetical protein